MGTKDVATKLFDKVTQSVSGFSRDKVGKFRESVDNDKNGVEPV